MKLKKQTSLLLIALLTVVMVFSLTACGDKKEGSSGTNTSGLELFTDGKLTVATDEPAWAPWVLDNTPESGEGFESALVYAIADNLGFAKDDVVWVRSPFDASISPGAKDYDFNLQQFSITDERKEVVDLSAPYFKEPRAIITMKDGKYAATTSISEFKDALFGAASGDVANQITQDFIKPNKDVQVFTNLVDVLAALKTGQIDATVVGITTASYIIYDEQLNENGVINGIIPGSADVSAGFGLLLPKGSPNTPILSKVIEELDANGTLKELSDKWLGDYNSVPELKD